MNAEFSNRPPMIDVRDVSYTYAFSGRKALDHVSLSVRPGEVVLCTGVSGCGKTTLIRTINGLCPQYYAGSMEGEVVVNGVSNAKRELPQIALDAGTLFQDPEAQFFALNVEDEMAFALEWQGKSRGEIASLIDRQSREFGLAKILSSSIHELSEGQKQKLGLATITMGGLKALILDEPTANLDPEATEDLAREIARLAAMGVAVLVVDHRLYWLKGVADRVVVLEEGRIVHEGALESLTDEIRARTGLRAIEVPDLRETLEDGSRAPKDSALLSFEGVTFRYKKSPSAIIDNASLSLGAGIAAVIGENGAGKTTLARVMTGLNKAEKGSFYLAGAPAAPSQLLRKVAIVLQNADHQLHMKTVLREVRTSLEAAGCRGGDEAAMELLRLFDLQDYAERHPQSLSGGQKQRLVICCAFAKNPDVIILDEPTSGLDGVNMKRIAAALEKLAAEGKCVLVITHDLELMALCCKKAVRLPLSQMN